MVKYKVSVIIPIYNAQDTIRNCIDSVINQTIGFSNIELILYDDNSTDNTRKILKEYSKKYDNITLILSAKNSGYAGKGRNEGIKKSTAKYLIFIDSDDEVLTDYCETLYNTISENDIDFVQCLFTKKIGKDFYVGKDIDNITPYSKKIIRDINKKIFLRGTACGGIFRRSLLKNNDIKFPNSLFEDGYFLLKTAIKSDEVISLNRYPGYIYNYNANSSTHKITSLKPLFDFINGFKLAKELLDENCIKYDDIFNVNLPMILFMFFKFRGSKDDKIKFFDVYRDFLISLDYPIKLRSVPLNILNEAILNKKYNKALFLSRVASWFYNNSFLRNLIHKRWSGLKKVDEVFYE